MPNRAALPLVACASMTPSRKRFWVVEPGCDRSRRPGRGTSDQVRDALTRDVEAARYEQRRSIEEFKEMTK
ncbi:hypothetical protein [Pseudaminobacter sp. NGMCC 1.201702]|uniref:hypothetical protein n=1 Tax=Pseudaminobacter sp. NGMCC 1.201702 TaxID=3391825 RepID=UPI0039F010C4